MEIIENKMGGKKFGEYCKRKKAQNLSSYEECINFIEDMRREENAETGIEVDSVLLPSMLMSQC